MISKEKTIYLKSPGNDDLKIIISYDYNDEVKNFSDVEEYFLNAQIDYFIQDKYNFSSFKWMVSSLPLEAVSKRTRRKY